MSFLCSARLFLQPSFSCRKEQLKGYHFDKDSEALLFEAIISLPPFSRTPVSPLYFSITNNALVRNGY